MLNASVQKVACPYLEGDKFATKYCSRADIYFLDTAAFPAITFVTQFSHHSDYTDMPNTQ